MPYKKKVYLGVENSRKGGRDLLIGIANYAHMHGPWAFYTDPPFYRNALKNPKSTRLLKWGVQGIITRSQEAVKGLILRGLPMIVHYKPKQKITKIPHIFTDCDAIGKMGANYFLKLGFRNFAFCGYNDARWSIERGNSFDKHLAEVGFKTHFYSEPSLYSNNPLIGEEQALCNWLKSLPLPIAIMACNDERGQEIIRACEFTGLHIPEEISILGVDNDEITCILSDIPLSSIALNIERAGYEAAELLDKLMDGEKMSGQIITISPTHIITRRSTDICAIVDEDIADAMNFIRENVKTNITAEMVADAVSLSRRSLYTRFKQVLGGTVHQEIVRMRIAEVGRMLTETNMTLSQIALALGYPDVKHISRCFKNIMGVSARVYRQHYGKK
jgi:LacI family transcriptional regulator